MNDTSNQERAVELLQELGLKEYEAKSFVALSRLPTGTAKEIAEISEVPRTRVYDAVRVLESKGLVEIQHSSPQQFRAVSIDEAASTLHDEFEARTDSLREALGSVEPASLDSESDVSHEVWGLSGAAAIRNRTEQLLSEAESEVIFVVGDEGALSDDVVRALRSAQDRGVSVAVGTVSESLRASVADRLPEAEAFVSGLEWLGSSDRADDETQISRLLLVDRETILVSTTSDHQRGHADEQAVFGRGFDNGLVTIARRLMSTGLFPAEESSGD